MQVAAGGGGEAAGTAQRHRPACGYESIWNGRDELVHRPSPPPATQPSAKLWRGCWRWRPRRDFDSKRSICRHCVRLRNSARLRESPAKPQGEWTVSGVSETLGRGPTDHPREMSSCAIGSTTSNGGGDSSVKAGAWIARRASHRAGRVHGARRVWTPRDGGRPSCAAPGCRRMVSRLWREAPRCARQRCTGDAMPALSGPSGRTEANARRTSALLVSRHRGSWNNSARRYFSFYRHLPRLTAFANFTAGTLGW